MVKRYVFFPLLLLSASIVSGHHRQNQLESVLERHTRVVTKEMSNRILTIKSSLSVVCCSGFYNWPTFRSYPTASACCVLTVWGQWALPPGGHSTACTHVSEMMNHKLRTCCLLSPWPSFIERRIIATSYEPISLISVCSPFSLVV